MPDEGDGLLADAEPKAGTDEAAGKAEAEGNALEASATRRTVGIKRDRSGGAKKGDDEKSRAQTSGVAGPQPGTAGTWTRQSCLCGFRPVAGDARN